MADNIYVSGSGQSQGNVNSPFAGTPALPGNAYTFAQLPSAASQGPGATVFTTDQGYVYSNGTTWSPFPNPVVGGRPVSVGAIGDSITAHCMPILDLSTGTAAQLYAAGTKTYGSRSWMTYGAMRSNNSWYAYDLVFGYSGATSAQILSTSLPALLGYPNGQPDACVVLAGTNDIGQTVPQATTIANLKAMYVGLLGAGITPIACTIPPTNANASTTQQLNWAIMRLAREFQIPLCDFYGTLVSPATGLWTNSLYTDDNTHPSPLGATLMGYTLNQAMQTWFRPSQKLVTGVFDQGAGVTTYLRDPNFQGFTGTVNTTSSYPTIGWGAPGTPSMSQITNSAGTEPGTGLSMWAATPAIAGQPANLLGNSWTLAGNGTNTVFIQGNTIAASPGDRIALSFRLKMIMNQAATSPGTANITVTGAVGSFGFAYITFGTAFGTGKSGQVGNETGYVAGDFYQEFTTLQQDNGYRAFIQLTGQGGSSNTGDSITIANYRLINLTKAGIVTP